MATLLLSGPALLRAANVSWVLDGNGSWQDAVNWSSNPALPGPSDGVTIDIGGGSQRVITHDKNADTIATLTHLEMLRITGGSLTVSGAVNLASGSEVQASGAGVFFTAVGSVAFDEANLFAQQGGTISLPGATSFAAPSAFNGNFEVTGVGSLIDLSAVTSFAGGNGRSMRVYSSNGGKLDLKSVPQIVSGATDVRANGANSVVDLSALTSFARTGNETSRLWAQGGGKVLTPNLTQVVDVDLRVDGASSQLDLAKLTSVDQTTITAAGGGQIALPLVTSYTGPSAYTGQLQAEGASSLLDLSTVTAFTGGGRATQVFATGGGKVDLKNVPQIASGATDMRASGPDSVIDLSALTSFTGTGNDTSRLWAQNGGKVLSPNLSTAVDIEVRVEGAGSSVDLSKLTSADRIRAGAANGGQLALPLVTSYHGPSNYNGQFESSGKAALLDLTAITSFAGGDSRATQVFASFGGKIDLKNVPQFDAGAVDLRSTGVDSVIDLSSLTSWKHTGGDTSRLWAQNGGKVLTPNMTSIVDVDLRVEGAGSQLDLGKLTTVDQVRISAVNGGQVALPLVTSYTGTAYVNGRFEASGIGALIDLSTITSFAGGNGRSAQVFANGGGKIDLANAPQFTSGAIDLRASGPGSVIDLASLTSWTHTGGDTSRLWVQNGGQVLSPKLATIVDVDIRVEGAASQLDFSKVTNVDRTNITAAGGGQFSLPLVTSYTGPSTNAGLFEASGVGSFIDLSTVTSFTGGDGRSARVFANGGGKVDLSNVQAINSGASDLRSTGAGSVLDVSKLAHWAHTGGDQSRWWVTDGGTALIRPMGMKLINVGMLVDRGGKLQGGTVFLAEGASLETAGGFAVELINHSGSVAAAGGLGEMDFGGAFYQYADARMRIRIASGNEHDSIEVAGLAKLGGRIDVVLMNNNTQIALGDTIPVLSAKSRQGNFDFGGALVNSSTFLTPVGVEDGVVLLAALAGDANLDGKIDLNDFGLLKASFGTGQRLSEGNMNGDTMVDLNDFGILKANFGRNDGPKLSDVGPTTAVPEPTTAVLLGIGLLALVARRSIAARARRRPSNC
jgi:hypothetical protein